MQPYQEFSELFPRVMSLMGPKIYGAFGVTAQQFRALRAIGLGPITVSELSAQFNAKLPAMTRLMRRLQEKGWVLKKQDPSDRRLVWLALTPEGRDFLEKLARRREEVIKDMFDPLAPDDQENIVRGIKLLLDSLGMEKTM